MKSIILVAFALVAVACAAPAVEEPVKILRSEFEQQPDGAYAHGYETENGINVQETGELKEALDEDNKPHTVVVVRGSYSYTDPEGNPVEFKYFADETGFHVEGDRVPKVPVARR